MTNALPLPFQIDDPAIQANFDALAVAVGNRALSTFIRGFLEAENATEGRTTLNVPPIIAGTVNGAGTVVVGSGFTVTVNGTGDYTINFTTAFASAPSVVAITHLGTADLIIAANGLPTTTACRLIIEIAGGGAFDATFSFVAIDT